MTKPYFLVDIRKSSLMTIIWSGGNASLSTDGWGCITCDSNTPADIALRSLFVGHVKDQSTLESKLLEGQCQFLSRLVCWLYCNLLGSVCLARIVLILFQSLDCPWINVDCQVWWFQSGCFWRTGLFMIIAYDELSDVPTKHDTIPFKILVYLCNLTSNFLSLCSIM